MHILLGSYKKQRGVALAVALILLVLVTLIGLAAIRGTTLEQKMTANFYDHEVSFQNAEAGLAAGAAALSAGITGIRNCGQGGDGCQANPFTDSGLTSTQQATYFKNVPTSAYTAGNTAAGQPQFVVEDMGTFVDPSSSTGFGQSANGAQYGAQGVSSTAEYYRITARSGDPTTPAGADRSVVTLQAMYKQ